MHVTNLFLQSNELSEDVWWVIGAAIVLLTVYFLSRKFRREQKTRDDLPPRTRIVNDSNYNINNTGVEDKKLEQLSPQEAQEVIDKMKSSDYIPTDEEFNELRRAKKRS
jgi:hypothetical protein